MNRSNCTLKKATTSKSSPATSADRREDSAGSAEKESGPDEGVRLIKKHLRKSQDNPSGKIAEREGPIHISNVKLVEREKETKKKSKSKATKEKKTK
jgi:hypothetical protein